MFVGTIYQSGGHPGILPPHPIVGAASHPTVQGRVSCRSVPLHSFLLTQIRFVLSHHFCLFETRSVIINL